MSTRPRPRPRRIAHAPPAPSPGPSPTDASSAPQSPVVSDVNVDDEDALFMRNRNRTAQTWKKLNKVAEEKRVAHKARESSDEEEDCNTSTPRRRKYKKKTNKDEALPDWTKTTSNMLSLLSSDDEDDILRRVEDEPSNAKREELRQARNGNNKRARSRSRSITPPPALPLHALQHARDAIRQIMGVVPRAASPTLVGEESTDTIVLDPELAMIAQQIRSQASQLPRYETPVPLDTGGPPIVEIKVLWKPHPMNKEASSDVWGFKLNRHDTFEALFAEAADLAGVIYDKLRVTYDNKQVFPSATPHSLNIWAEAELEACDVKTYEYLQANRRQRSISIQPRDHSERSPSMGRSPTPIAEESDADTGAGAESESDKFRLTLRSGKTKDVVLTVRPSTTCGAIVKAFLKKTGLSDQYEASTATVGKGKGKKNMAGLRGAPMPMLMLDGDKLDPASEIGEADLDDGDLLEVVGL